MYPQALDLYAKAEQFNLKRNDLDEIRLVEVLLGKAECYAHLG